MEKKYLTVKEAARYLGVTPLTLRNWDKKGKLSPARHPINTYRVYDKIELDAIFTHIENRSVPKKEVPRVYELKVKHLRDDES